MFTKLFQTRIEEANKVFVSALEKLKYVQSYILNQMNENNISIEKLRQENEGLECMKSQTGRQIIEIEKIIGE